MLHPVILSGGSGSRLWPLAQVSGADVAPIAPMQRITHAVEQRPDLQIHCAFPRRGRERATMAYHSLPFISLQGAHGCCTR